MAILQQLVMDGYHWLPPAGLGVIPVITMFFSTQVSVLSTLSPKMKHSYPDLAMAVTKNTSIYWLFCKCFTLTQTWLPVHTCIFINLPAFWPWKEKLILMWLEGLFIWLFQAFTQLPNSNEVSLNGMYQSKHAAKNKRKQNHASLK